MGEWRPGFVVSAKGQVRLELGQTWVVYTPRALMLAVVSLSEVGEVVLRPEDPALAESLYPLQPTVFKGKETMSRTCPFHWVTAKAGKAQPGDLACHEAWDVWSSMVRR